MATLTGILKVSPAVMTQYASTFGTSAGEVNTLTNNMLSIVAELCSRWHGQASNMYLRKFNTLQDDMKRMYNMMREHSDDLRVMANNYNNAESANTGSFRGLAEDVIV